MATQRGDCHSHGVYMPSVNECRCTAGWDGRLCEQRHERSCNRRHDNGLVSTDSLCAGNCDEDRGLCYCAGLERPFQRPLPHTCAPSTHRDTKLPDRRPSYPVRVRGGWEMANLVYEQPTQAQPWLSQWARYYAQPFEAIYGFVAGNPQPWPGYQPSRSFGWCEPRPALKPRSKSVAIDCGRGGRCYEGTTGPLCERPKAMYCLRDCMGRGRCDSGFCWCHQGWHGIDCSIADNTQPSMNTLPSHTLPAADQPAKLPAAAHSSPSMPGPVPASPLRVKSSDVK